MKSTSEIIFNSKKGKTFHLKIQQSCRIQNQHTKIPILYANNKQSKNKIKKTFHLQQYRK